MAMGKAAVSNPPWIFFTAGGATGRVSGNFSYTPVQPSGGLGAVAIGAASWNERRTGYSRLCGLLSSAMGILRAPAIWPSGPVNSSVRPTGARRLAHAIADFANKP